MINLSIALKNCFKNQNQFKSKNQLKTHTCFFTNFKGKKTLGMNFPHQMEPFDPYIVCFGSLNWCQQHFSLSTTTI
jgi:hypothetical protein